MDSRLNIVLSADSNGDLLLSDNTNYSEWTTDVYNHIAIERLLDYNSELLTTKINTLDNSLNSTFPLNSDGMYIYQKLLIPTYDHEGEDICYYDDGKIYLNGEIVKFEDVWSVKSEIVNIFWFDDVFFSIYDLVKCFIVTETNRLNAIFKSGCKIQCSENPYAANADFLASAIFVIRDLIDKNRYIEAQSLLNRLEICNGLCKNVSNKLKNCGCGDN